MLAGANPGAFIDDVVMHGDGETGIILGYDEMIMGQLEHSADEPDEKQEEKGGPMMNRIMKRKRMRRLKLLKTSLNP